MPIKGRNTRLVILDAAGELFYHQGFNATSYADIAEQTGVGKGNIHYHFNSKNILLEATVARRLENIRKLLEQWTLDCVMPYDCINRFIDMVENNADDLSRYGCPMGTLNDELGKNNRELQHAARQMFDLFLRWLEARFKALMPPESAKEHAEQLMAMMQGTGVMAHAYNDPEIVRRQVKAMRNWLANICEK